MEANEPLAQVSLDARNLRGIAHPLRVRILGILRAEGPATASTLARRLDESTGATSYHLRQLAEYGFIVEAPSRGGRRERWWQAAHANTVVGDRELLAEGEGPGAAFLQSLVRVWSDNMARAVAATPQLPQEWREAQDFGDYMVDLTPQEAGELMAEIHEVLRRRSAQAKSRTAEGASPVTFQFQLFPSTQDRRAQEPTESE